MPTMKLPPKTIANLLALHPVSIVITGSAASEEAGRKSDTDVMVIFEDENYIHRKELKKFAPLIRRADRMRKNGGNLTEQNIFDNMKYLHHIART